MTELEGQLTTALERLSEQFRTEQRLRAEEQQRHSEELEASRRRSEQQSAEIEALRQLIERQSVENATLRQRIERLDGLVTPLARDYETLAATLRGLWR